MFSYQTHGQQLSPFLLLDYAGPYTFPAGSEKRGVGEHPHRGFETVTIVYAGEVEHRDSTGRGGVIGPGDVQWMTAGAGILHEEFHSGGLHPQRRRAEDDPAVGQPARERQNGGPRLPEYYRRDDPHRGAGEPAPDRFGLLPASMTTSAARPIPSHRLTCGICS